MVHTGIEKISSVDSLINSSNFDHIILSASTSFVSCLRLDVTCRDSLLGSRLLRPNHISSTRADALSSLASPMTYCSSRRISLTRPDTSPTYYTFLPMCTFLASQLYPVTSVGPSLPPASVSLLYRASSRLDPMSSVLPPHWSFLYF